MAKIQNHVSKKTTKMLLIGDSGSGKTGALASLAAAGYKLRILDFDNGLDVLKNYVSSPLSPYVMQNPNIADNVDYITCSDTMKNVAGRLYASKAIAWPTAINALIHWKDADTDLGKVADWDHTSILVIDSLSMLSTAALNFHLGMNAALGSTRTSMEARRDIGETHKLLRSLLETLYDTSFKCNIIVTSHIVYVDDKGANPSLSPNDSMGQGYPAAIGRALSPIIPRFFNSMLLMKNTGAGAGTKRMIHTTPQVIGGQMILSKSSNPLAVKSEYPVATGLADYFKAIQS